jgi:hypothetical protein
MKFAAVLLICAGIALGQEAQISGFIQDPAGLNVAGAGISLRNEQTGGKRGTLSNESGFYSIPSLKPGLYRVSIQAPGFETIVQEALKLEVGDSARLDFALHIGDARTVITVKGGPPPINTEDASVGTVIGRDIIDKMPLNGRGIQALIDLTPGVVVVPVTVRSAGQFAVNGQRTDANYFTVDGVSANFAAAVISSNTPVHNAIGQAGNAALPANNLVGTFSNLVSPDALQEFKIETSTFAPEFGRSPGAQVALVTRSGTNRYSGSLFEYLRNDVTDANDWFADRSGLGKAPLRFNNFGGTLGGPVRIPHLYNGHDRTFFFFSSEDLLMRQPQPPSEILVPTIQTRLAAPPPVAALLNVYPLPNRPGTDLGPAILGWEARSEMFSLPHDEQTYGLRVDHYFSEKLTAFARYNQSSSAVSDNVDAGFPVDTTHYAVWNQMLTLGLTQTVGASLVHEFRLNGSRQQDTVRNTINQSAGGDQPPDGLLFPPGFSLRDSNAILYSALPMDTEYSLGLQSSNSSTQLQLVDGLSYTRRTHQLKFGIDYRLFSPVDTQPGLSIQYQFDNFYGSSTPYNGIAASVFMMGSEGQVTYRAPALSAFVQDTWRARRNLTFTYGMRWDADIAPHVSGGMFLLLNQLTNLNDFTNVSLAPPGKAFYRSDYRHFAPRVGLAWQIFNGPNRETVLRAGAGTFYDLGQTGFEDSYAEGHSGGIYSDVLIGTFPGNPPFHLYTVSDVAAPGFTMPRVHQWNATLEQLFGQQTLSVGYVGALGRHLVGSTSLVLATFPDVDIHGSQFSSAYHSLQLQFNRRLTHRVQSLVSYTWSHSIDNVSTSLGSEQPQLSPFGTPTLDIFRNPNLNRGSSDFDIRHSLNGALLIDLPSPRRNAPGANLLRNWSANSIFFARSALPSDVVIEDANGYEVRPDLLAGTPLYLYGPAFPGGKGFNPAAFAVPAGGSEMGDFGRNVLRGFGAWQIDFALQRRFRLSESASLQFRAEAFNILNHPNFANPSNISGDPLHDKVSQGFGYSQQTLANSLSSAGTLGELNPLFQIGGPRTLQFALRLKF